MTIMMIRRSWWGQWWWRWWWERGGPGGALPGVAAPTVAPMTKPAQAANTIILIIIVIVHRRHHHRQHRHHHCHRCHHHRHHRHHLHFHNMDHSHRDVSSTWQRWFWCWKRGFYEGPVIKGHSRVTSLEGERSPTWWLWWWTSAPTPSRRGGTAARTPTSPTSSLPPLPSKFHRGITRESRSRERVNRGVPRRCFPLKGLATTGAHHPPTTTAQQPASCSGSSHQVYTTTTTNTTTDTQIFAVHTSYSLFTFCLERRLTQIFGLFRPEPTRCTLYKSAEKLSACFCVCISPQIVFYSLSQILIGWCIPKSVYPWLRPSVSKFWQIHKSAAFGFVFPSAREARLRSFWLKKWRPLTHTHVPLNLPFRCLDVIFLGKHLYTPYYLKGPFMW